MGRSSGSLRCEFRFLVGIAGRDECYDGRPIADGVLITRFMFLNPFYCSLVSNVIKI